MMSSKFLEAAICLLLWMTLASETHGAVFDIKTYGATADGKTDDSQAINTAWAEACKATEPSQVLIPAGTYLAGAMRFLGPCKGPVEIQATGAIVKAPPEVEKFASVDCWILIKRVDKLSTVGGTFDGQGEIAWGKNDCAKIGKCNSLPVNLRFEYVTNSVIKNITSVNSKLFHIKVLGCENFTMEHTTVNAPETSPNSDGIHVSKSKDVKILGADIKTGDDCLSFGHGCVQVLAESVTCGPGHGISIGSLGRYKAEEPVDGITVRNCTITGTTNGVRIKTWLGCPEPGTARNMHFENIIMNNVGSPVLIDQEYCPYGHCQAEIPSTIKLSDVSFKGIQGTSSTKVAVKLVCSKSVPCENVTLSDVNLVYKGPEGDVVSECANVKPVITGKVFPPPCAAPHTS